MLNRVMSRSLVFLRSLTVCLFILSAFPLMGHSQVFQSKDSQVSLVELYTSEGCSSCPPADTWLSGLKENDGLWEDFVPLAFHVTYWDYIGWKDRLGSKDYANRQRNYAASWNARTVYTPGFVLNGREFRRRGSAKTITLGTNAAAGRLRIQNLGNDQYELTYLPADKTVNVWIGNMTIMGFDIESKIAAGENRGRNLKHDFAVLTHKRQVLNPNHEGVLSTTFQLKRDDRLNPSQFGVAAWVHDQRRMEPVQATGGYLS